MRRASHIDADAKEISRAAVDRERAEVLNVGRSRRLAARDAHAICRLAARARPTRPRFSLSARFAMWLVGHNAILWSVASVLTAFFGGLLWRWRRRRLDD